MGNSNVHFVDKGEERVFSWPRAAPIEINGLWSLRRGAGGAQRGWAAWIRPRETNTEPPWPCL